MDLEIMGFDGLLGSDTTTTVAAGYLSSESKKRIHESEFLTRLNSEDFSSSSVSKIRSINNYLSENGQHMLSFSSSSSSSTSPLSYYNDLYQQASAFSYGRNPGTAALMNRMRTGPFTQSQWIELENQALIYKYINANAPIPSNLLIPILKSSDFSNSYPPFSVGWGPFHLGFSNSTDPEPGRCRRTDGKKWRCARDAVPDHKYCERHMNRGRHRSRKPVEGQTARSVVVSSAAGKLVQAEPAPAPATVTSDGLSLSQPGGPITSPSSNNGNRVFLNMEKEKPMEYTSNKSQVKFGSFGVDTLLSNGSSSSSLMENEEYMIMNNSTKNKQHNNWLPSSWFDTNNHQHDGTQLSISIPMMSDFIPSMNETHQVPSTEMGLGLGLGESYHKQSTSWIPVQWGSINNCMGGGPLGEVVLNKTNRNDQTDWKKKSSSSSVASLDLMSSTASTGHNWDNSPRGFGSSPTGVLHKVHFGSVSNSSAGSSPRTESHFG
ncbi:growth-regulating factor 1-like [Impatiens glandulifera]|uniref:growth-regulating factor 1-like n=1 Tax=Impatiens glandulifera TaxID=253017 RepID=UPI001FB09C15|nr:growth-regulating factor 1-like [Impatiens glandulifera]